MKRLLLVNTTINTRAPGTIAEQIGRLAGRDGYEVLAAHGILHNRSQLQTIKIGNRFDHCSHALLTRISDRHGYGSAKATSGLIKRASYFQPDIINLHNVHGYYLNVPMLFEWLARLDKPVVWTLHDSWAFTGHCASPLAANCDNYLSGCVSCPDLRQYPATWGTGRSARNYSDKKALFTALNKLTIVVPSQWLANTVAKSFLGAFPILVIPNGIDTDVFSPVAHTPVANMVENLKATGKTVYLAVASKWSGLKGFHFLPEISHRLRPDEQLLVAGVDRRQSKWLSSRFNNITTIERADNPFELASLYAAADVTITPTLADNFPSVHLESLACGTPVATFASGGAGEALDAATGISVPTGDCKALLDAARRLATLDREKMRQSCRTRAVTHFRSSDCFGHYIELFNSLTL